MGARIHPAIKSRARELWEDEGYSPEQILEALSFELLAGTLEVPVANISKVDLPGDRSILYKWAKQDGWRSWREAKKKVDQKIEKDIAEGAPFPISGIRDPIWHLSVVTAQRYIEAMLPPVYSVKTADEIATDTLLHVHQVLHPGPRVMNQSQKSFKPRSLTGRP
jgi:hypothetical protein